MSLLVKAGKAGKQFLKRYLLPQKKPSVGYTRRIERVATKKRILAMTFDDGPMDLPCSPDRFGGRSLTDVLLDVLAAHGAKGTFDVVGDTSENYPDEAGRAGSPAWGGIRYDHYPDIRCDERGGVLHNDRLVRRILAEGHQITSHSWRHMIFGPKNVVYGRRAHFASVDEAVADLEKLDRYMKEHYGYAISLHRPPHYVDAIAGGFTSYDVCDALGYQYLAASFDGAGWLPSAISDGAKAYDAEVAAMTGPMRALLEKDPDALCGQIVFQKDGYNMARRTPVADGLEKQLELLDRFGYRVVTVDELLAESPFADLGRDDPLFETACGLLPDHAFVYADNTVRADDAMTMGELSMFLAPKDGAMDLRWDAMRRLGHAAAPYAGAWEYCLREKLIPYDKKPEEKTGETRRTFLAKYKSL